MKNDQREINLFDLSQTEYRSTRVDKIKTTDVNILLNRVRLTRKTEFKKKIIIMCLLLLAIGFVGFFSLI